MNTNDMMKPGQEVKFRKQFGGSSINHGTIKAVWISSNGVLYQVAYIHSGKLEEPYVPGEMIEPVNNEPLPTGFQLNKPKQP